MQEQLELFNEKLIDNRQEFAVFPKYWTAIRINAYWVHCADSFLWEKGNFNYPIGKIERGLFTESELHNKGFHIITPTCPTVSFYSDYKRKINPPKKPGSIVQYVDI